MARTRKERPDGCVFFGTSLKQLLLLPDASAGRVIKAATVFFLTNQDPPNLELDIGEKIVYSALSDNIRDSLSRFTEMCIRNRKIAESRENGERLATSGNQPSPGATNRTEKNQTELNQIDLKRVEENRTLADKPPHTRFVPPSVEEVDAYCRGRRNSVDARRFHDYYESNGWKVGKNAMKSWQAAVRTWERGEKTKNIQSPERYRYEEGESL